MEAKYIEVDINSILLLDNNPRTISDEDLDKLVQDIKNDPEFLNQRPPLINKINNELFCYAGTQRVKAAKLCGYKSIYVFIEEDLPKQIQDERMIKDNLHRGKWDEGKLLELNFDLDILKDFGFNDFEVSIFQEVKEPLNLTAELKDAPPTMKLTFKSTNQMEKFENELKQIIKNNSQFNSITYSVSAGEM